MSTKVTEGDDLTTTARLVQEKIGKIPSNRDILSWRLYPKVFEDYCKQMEVPKRKNRWDTPMFELYHDEKTKLDELADILLFQKK